MTEPRSIPALLEAAEGGDRDARDRLFAALYGELREIARSALRKGAGAAANLSPTTVVHEIYAGMAGREGLSFPDRSRFLAYAARAMRGFIIDSLRNGSAQKRGSDFLITHLDGRIEEAVPDPQAADLTRLSDALDELASVDPRLAELVDLKFFCGFSLVEIAQMTGISERTAQRAWEKARLVLFDALRDDG